MKLQIVASLTGNSSGVIHDRNIFLRQAAGSLISVRSRGLPGLNILICGQSHNQTQQMAY